MKGNKDLVINKRFPFRSLLSLIVIYFVIKDLFPKLKNNFIYMI